MGARRLSDAVEERMARQPVDPAIVECFREAWSDRNVVVGGTGEAEHHVSLSAPGCRVAAALRPDFFTVRAEPQYAVAFTNRHPEVSLQKNAALGWITVRRHAYEGKEFRPALFELLEHAWVTNRAISVNASDSDKSGRVPTPLCPQCFLEHRGDCP